MKKEKRMINIVSFTAILVLLSIAVALFSSENKTGFIFFYLAAICNAVLIANR